LDDYLNGRLEVSNAVLGKRIVLPSTHNGGPRYMQQSFNDAMTMVRRDGKPDLFITITCNLQDPDILENIEPDEQPIHRPDIVARVFKLKVDQFIIDIVKGETFGEVISWCYVIEFQKRGLPHMHTLFTLAN
jgi:hypothetical protein